MKKFIALLTIIWCISLVSAQNFTTVYEWMFEKGLTTMSSEADFRPNDTVTRGEISKFFTRFAEVQSMTKVKSASECAFGDLEGYDATLVPTIIEACEYGLVKGSQWNYFPNKALTEAEALTVIVRAIMGMQDETKDPWWTEYYEVGKWLSIIDNEGVRDLNKNALRGKVGIRLWRAAQVDTNAVQQEWTDEVKDVLTEIFGEEFWNE